MLKTPIKTNDILQGVRYEIRGELAARAVELERKGYEIISLNIGNPGLFGFRTPLYLWLPWCFCFPSVRLWVLLRFFYPFWWLQPFLGLLSKGI